MSMEYSTRFDFVQQTVRTNWIIESFSIDGNNRRTIARLGRP
jgi:hypothetical protein